jgi:alkylation response protein AidB-like acyl-CoA dehydrogenase
MSTAPTVDEFRASARDWIAANLEPRDPAERAPQHQDAHYTPEYLAVQRAMQRRLFEAGFAGITWPEEYGGRGLSAAHQIAFTEEAAGHRLPDFGKTTQTTYGVCGPTLLACASDEFKRRHIPRILAGDELWAQFFSEPDAGSDLANILTRAERRGDDWVINGTKVWSSFAERCDFGLCLTRTDGSGDKHEGLTWFAVSTRADGLLMRPVRQVDGSEGFCEELFTDVVVPDAERVGEVGDGWAVTRRMLSFERDSEGRRGGTTLAPGGLGQDLLDILTRSGRPVDAVVRQLLAAAHVDDYVKEQVYSRAGAGLPADVAEVGLAAFGKLGAGIFDPIRARIGLELAGESGAVWDPAEVGGADPASAYLNGRMYAIAGGTNEMQRNAISERILGLPREPRADAG